MSLSIGELARRTGSKVQTIRYYEEIGLLPPPGRTAGNQRRYDRATADRLAFIRHGRALGFSLDEIRDLLRLTDHPELSCEAADAIARKRLADVERRIARLESLRTELSRMVEQCRGGTVAGCRVIEVLADHELCLAEDHAVGHGAPAGDGVAA